MTQLSPPPAARPEHPPAEAMLAERHIGLLAVASAASVASNYYIQPLLLQIGRSVAIPPHLLGLLPALIQTGIALGVLFLLPLADRISARRLLLAVVPLQAAALALVAISIDGPMLAVACLLIGLAGITPYVLPPYASLRSPPDRIGRVTGLLTRGVIIGILLARTVSGLLGTLFGWRPVYAVASAVMLVVFAILSRLVHPTTPHPDEAHRSYRALIGSLVHLLRELPALRTAALCQALGFGSFNVLWLGMVFYLQSPRFGWSPAQIGLVGIVGALGASAAPLFGHATDRIGPNRTRTLAYAAMALGWVLLALFRHSLAGMALGLVVFDIGATVGDISGRTILYRLAPGIRSRLNAVYTVAMFAGAALCSSLVGWSWTGAGWLGLCILGLVPTLIALLASSCSRPFGTAAAVRG